MYPIIIGSQAAGPNRGENAKSAKLIANAKIARKVRRPINMFRLNLFFSSKYAPMLIRQIAAIV